MLKNFLPEQFKEVSLYGNILRTVQLILSLSPLWTLTSVVLMCAETASFFFALRSFKQLVNILTQQSELSESGVYEQLILIGLVSVLFITIRSVSAYVTDLNSVYLTRKMDDRIHEKSLSLEYAFFESPQYFDILKRALEEAHSRPVAILNNLNEIIKNSVIAFGFLYIIVTINWVLLPCILVMVAPGFLVKAYTSRKYFKWYRRRTELDRKAGYLRSVITGDLFAKEIRVFGFGTKIKNMYDALRLTITDEQLQVKRTATWLDFIANVISTSGFILCIGLIAINITKGVNSMGDIALLLLSFLQTFNVMQQLTTNISQLLQNNLYIGSIFELLDLKPTANKKGTEKVAFTPEKALVMKDVHFTYPNTTKEVLSNINVAFQPGKVTALVGLNGSGKSTLIKLITGLYPATEGQILYGDTPIQDLEPDAFRNLMSVVFQDFGKYHFTAGENIQIGDASREYITAEVEQAAVRSGANLYIDQFALGYETQMGKLFEDGQEISIGQWQKLALARALYRDAHFIILDEATSAIDSLAENELISLLQKQMGDKGIILISHRLSVIKHADYIYVLSGGEMVQEGTHQNLVREKGPYYHQFKNDLEPV